VRSHVLPSFGLFVLALFCLPRMAALSADSFSSGEDSFNNNQPEKAIAFFEAAIRENPDKEIAYIHLGAAYAQLKRFEDAIAVFKRGAARFEDRNYEFFYNIGDCYFMQNKSAFAKEWYDQAIASRSDYAIAYLNRANVFMKLRDFPSAISDFREYLSLAPTSTQRENIEKIISLIQSGIDEADRKKAEDAARLAAEEAKRQQMLADVAASLKESATDTQSLSAGSENAEGYTDESELAE